MIASLTHGDFLLGDVLLQTSAQCDLTAKLAGRAIVHQQEVGVIVVEHHIVGSRGSHSMVQRHFLCTNTVVVQVSKQCSIAAQMDTINILSKYKGCVPCNSQSIFSKIICTNRKGTMKRVKQIILL